MQKALTNYVTPSMVKVALLVQLFLLLTVNLCGGYETRLACYFTNWSPGRAGEYSFNVTGDVPVELCTHLTYTFAGVDEQTYALRATDESFDVLQQGYEQFASLKKANPNLKLSLAVGGWAHGATAFQNMAATLTTREAFIGSVVDFLKRHDFDAIEIVWLWPGSPDRGGTDRDKDNFFLLIAELKNTFREAGQSWEVIVQVPIEQYRIEIGYHQTQLCRTADYLYLTGYDLRGSWNGYTDVHSPMSNRAFDAGALVDLNVKTGVEYWMRKGCPAKKLVLGVPLFGRTFTLVNPDQHGLGAASSGPGHPGPHSKEAGYRGYFEICEDMQRSTWKTAWDVRGLCPYAYQGNQWVGYENEDSLTEKANFAKQMKLGGVYAFSLDLDDYRGKCGERYPLLTALRDAYMPEQPCATDGEQSFALFREPCDPS